MGRRHSETELAGKLGASLTAPAPHASRRRREAEASSVFDLAQPRRADAARHRLRSRPGARPSGTIPLPSRVLSAPPEEEIKPLLVVPVVRPASLYVGSELSGLRSKPVPAPGLDHAVRGAPRQSADAALGVAVAWVATIATGILAATALPAHVVMRSARSAVFAAVPSQSMAAPNAGTMASAAPTSSIAPLISRSLVDPSAPAAISRRPAGQVRPKWVAPAQVHPVAAQEPSSPADDDNPYAVAPPSLGAAEPSVLTLEDLMRRAVEKESKPRR